MAAHSDTFTAYLARRLIRQADEDQPPASDADQLTAYADDPVGFAINVLGIEPWSRQRELLEAPLRHQKISCVSGHKIGKSTALAILALWFYCSFPGSRVVITAATDKQVNKIIWREVKRLARNARVKIPGALPHVKTARTGYTHPTTGAEIQGFTAKDAEAMAGWSGPAMLFLVDEASGVASEIYAAIEGNRAGGNAYVFLISNPTKAHGEFYESHHSQSEEKIGEAGYHTIHVDSRESPNVTGEWRSLRRWDPIAKEWLPYAAPIPGLATERWVQDKLRTWGEDHPDFKIRVAGLFCVAEEAKVFSSDLLDSAEARWPSTVPTGRIWIGCDPAGDGTAGDGSAFALRRGQKLCAVRKRYGLSPERHVAEILDMIDEAIAAGAPAVPLPIVNVDSEGLAGWKVYLEIRKHADSERPRFICSRIRTSNEAVRQPEVMANHRAELWANARQWVREGGALPPDKELRDDLHAPEFESGPDNRTNITRKKELRKMLGRSPDLGDAVVLACWEPIWANSGSGKTKPARELERDDSVPELYREPVNNPYHGGDVFAPNGRSPFI